MCPDQKSNQRPLGLWDDTQPTELHQSGMQFLIDCVKEEETIRHRISYFSTFAYIIIHTSSPYSYRKAFSAYFHLQAGDPGKPVVQFKGL